LAGGAGAACGVTGQVEGRDQKPARLIRLGPVAEQHVADLLRHYAYLGRPEAGDNLVSAIDEACLRIETDPAAGLAAPRPYRTLTRAGVRWLKAGRYWFAYTIVVPVSIVGVFYEQSDIPGRF